VTVILPDNTLFNDDKRRSPAPDLRVTVIVPPFFRKRVAVTLPG
jgi:hypothetical protein